MHNMKEKTATAQFKKRKIKIYCHGENLKKKIFTTALPTNETIQCPDTTLILIANISNQKLF